MSISSTQEQICDTEVGSRGGYEDAEGAACALASQLRGRLPARFTQRSILLHKWYITFQSNILKFKKNPAIL